MPAAHCLQIAGLVIGFAGALLVTVTQEPGGGIERVDKKGRVAPYIVLAHPRLWKLGLYLLSVGFAIQLIGEVL